jgi:FHS family Na+ dependent glucose MFS transporter 1
VSDTRTVRSLSAGCFIAFTVLGLTVTALGTALPHLGRQTESSLKLISYIFVGHSLGYMAGTFFGGPLFDRLPGNRLMAGSLFAFLPLLVLIPLMRSFVPLLAVYLTLGFFQGALDVGGNTLILWSPVAGRGVRMNALHLSFGLGAFLSPLILGQAVRWTGGIRWGYWCLALLTVPAAFWFLRLPEPPRPGASGGGADAPVPLLPVATVAAFIFLAVALETGFGNWIYTYALTLGIGNDVSASYLASFFWGIFTGGRLLFTFLAARLRAALLLGVCLLGVLGGVAVMVLAPGTTAVVWLATAAIGLFVGPLVANTFMVAGEIMEITGRVTGILMVFLSLGGLSLPWIIGQLFEAAGPGVMPLAVLTAVVAALPVYALMRRLQSAGSTR